MVMNFTMPKAYVIDIPITYGSVANSGVLADGSNAPWVSFKSG